MVPLQLQFPAFGDKTLAILYLNKIKCTFISQDVFFKLSSDFNRFFLDTLDYTHYGEIYKNTDMRAEVGLLSRNIRFDSEAASDGNEYGGHLKVSFFSSSLLFVILMIPGTIQIFRLHSNLNV